MNILSTLSILLVSLLLTQPGWASQVYVTQDRAIDAIQNIYGATGGFGAKTNSCLLCHASTSGGPGNLNSSFGRDFQDRARALGYPDEGGGQLPVSGSQSLEALFSDNLLLTTDSDGDGFDNDEEFSLNRDPADDIANSSGDGGGGGGGCGLIGPISNKKDFPPPSSGLLLLIPLILAIYMRSRSLIFTKPQM